LEVVGVVLWVDGFEEGFGVSVVLCVPPISIFSIITMIVTMKGMGGSTIVMVLSSLRTLSNDSWNGSKALLSALGGWVPGNFVSLTVVSNFFSSALGVLDAVSVRRRFYASANLVSPDG
jgi:hypothetical protein